MLEDECDDEGWSELMQWKQANPLFVQDFPEIKAGKKEPVEIEVEERPKEEEEEREEQEQLQGEAEGKEMSAELSP